MRELPPYAPVESKRVLVVDDDAAIRALIVVALSVAGFETAAAAGGHEALEILGVFRPHVVILDDVMPALSGREVAWRIRAEPLGARVKILLIAAAKPDEISAAAGRPEVDARLAKPFDPDVLVQWVRELAGVAPPRVPFV